ncbi:MAG: AhpC/TSA family protein [Bacteroidales bacterium]|nr:AhpC/TSA family protein [Bacteroidales bacterium]
MRVWLTLIVIGIVSCTTNDSKNFQIDGFVEGATDRIIIVKKFDGEGYITIDSIKVRNGEFSYKGKLKHPELFRFYLNNTEEYFPVFIENKRIAINTSVKDFRSAKVSGSESHMLYMSFVYKVDSINRSASPLIVQLKNKQLDENKKIAIKARLDSISKQQLDYVKSFVLMYPRSVVSLYILYKYLSNELPVEEFEQLYRQMDTSLYQTKYANYIEHQLEILKHTQVGQKAFNIILPDTTGTSVALHDIKSRFVIVQFWASWCDACREEMPEMVKYFEKNKKQLSIYSVSLDTNFKRWTEAIRYFKMNWTNVSDLKGWKNSAAVTFGIRSIPSYILLDEEKKILYRGSSLDQIKNIMEVGR